jgi:hypothetical protein
VRQQVPGYNFTASKLHIACINRNMKHEYMNYRETKEETVH